MKLEVHWLDLVNAFLRPVYKNGDGEVKTNYLAPISWSLIMLLIGFMLGKL